jgi:hypothetical protein
LVRMRGGVVCSSAMQNCHMENFNMLQQIGRKVS